MDRGVIVIEDSSILTHVSLCKLTIKQLKKNMIFEIFSVVDIIRVKSISRRVVSHAMFVLQNKFKFAVFPCILEGHFTEQKQ